MFSTDDEDENELDKPATEVGGPYNVEYKKPYKPVFIVFLDMIFAISFFSFTTLYYWTKIESNEKVENWTTFINKTVLWFDLILILKIPVDIFYLQQFAKPKDMNRSKSTQQFFWFRLIFDFICFNAILFYYHYAHKRNLIKKIGTEAAGALKDDQGL